MAKGYWVVHVTVEQQDRYGEYVAAATPAYEEFGAKFLVRGGAYEAMEGESRPRTVVVEFPSHEAAVACYNSETYQKARAIRQEIAKSDFMIIQGHDG